MADENTGSGQAGQPAAPQQAPAGTQQPAAPQAPQQPQQPQQPAAPQQPQQPQQPAAPQAPQAPQGSPQSMLSGEQPTTPQATPQQTGQQPPAPKSGGFHDQITDETIRNDPSLQSISSLDDLAKSYVHAQHLVGKDKIALPSNENDHEAWNDVLSKLGRPDSPEKYELPKPAEDSPVHIPEGMDQEFSKKAHELGLTNKQARDLFGWYVSDVAEGQHKQFEQQVGEARQSAEQELRKEFGNAFTDKVQAAHKAVQTYGGDEVLKVLETSGLGNDPNVVRMFAKLGENLREDTVGGSSPTFGRTPDQATSEMQRLKSDQQFMKVYLDDRATGHAEAVQRMNALYADAYPEQKRG